MQFKSTKNDRETVSFREAALRCLPDDGGLYAPASDMDLRHFLFYMDADTSFPELVAALAPLLLQDALTPHSAARIAESAFHFEPEFKPLDERFSLLNLYNGPSGVCKDFGIAFLAAVIEELLKSGGQAMIISASRGDTGISVASAFRGRRGIRPVILYPSGPIRGLDPGALASQGGPLIPLQVRGTFDDCQRLMAEIIRDRPFSNRYGITSANTINAGALLPQIFYYIYGFIKAKPCLNGDLLFSVPSGNFGNLIAGLYAWKSGMPVNGFVAAMNRNNPVGEYMRGRPFIPRVPAATVSPALDVGMPANYERLASFYQDAPVVMRNMVYPCAVDDALTLKTIEGVWKRYGLLIDPHTAVAFAAAERFSAQRDSAHLVILGTSHPAREANAIALATGQKIEIPPRFALLREKTDPLAVIDPELSALEGAIASCV
ncbi:MAG: threonine synthase [Treponema sp.]|jgi:threonine synthase|nr:threonine synthase [Treponema sp.]